MDDKKEMDVSTLNNLYLSADNAWKELFSEQRSNVKLYLGLHYPKKALKGLSRLTDAAPSMGKNQKLRLTKNHIGVIMDKRINTVVSHAPAVFVEARHSTEVGDKQAADVAGGIWKDIQLKNDFETLTDDLAFDYEVVGEAFCYVFFDQNKGRISSEKVLIGDDGQPTGETQPVYDGQVRMKKLEPFNVLVDPQARSFETSEWVMYREMVSTKKLRTRYADDKDILNAIKQSSEESFTIFDSHKGTLTESGDDQCLIKFKFIRPCIMYPKGYYYIFITDMIMSHGELGDVFPIEGAFNTKVTSSPRGYSKIKRLRGPQAEVNRIASQIAETQIYFKDRLLVQGATKLSHAGTVAGTVGIRYNGATPTIMHAKSGEQYLAVLSNEVSEMYRLGEVPELDAEKMASADPRAYMYANAKQKLKFAKTVSRFEHFLTKVAMTSLKTAQLFYTQEHYVPALDKKEWIAIDDFKAITEFEYSLKVRPMSQDIDSKMGEQMAIEHAMQYSQNLPPEQTAALLSDHPYLKDSALVQELTADIRACEDVFTQLNKGQSAPISEYDNHKYFIRKIANRMKESSFRMLDQPVQDLYIDRYQQHQQIEASQAEKMQRAQMGMLDAGGGLVTISGIKDAEGNVLRLPYNTIMQTVKRLQEQGSMQNIVMSEVQNQGAIADLAQLTTQNQSQNQTPQSPQPMAGGY